MDKLIIDGKDYGEDYISYNRDYNNKVWEQLRMKNLNEIPQEQIKRPKIKRYKTNDFTSRSEKIHTILSLSWWCCIICIWLYFFNSILISGSFGSLFLCP